MRGHSVNLLNQWRFARRRGKAVVAQRLHGAAGEASGQADRNQPGLARRLERSDDVGRAPRGGDCDEDVAGPSQPPDLPFEGTLEAIIIADRGNNGAVGGQRDSRQRMAVKIQPRQEFAGDMLRVGGAAAISRDQQFIPGAECRGNNVGNGVDGREKLWIVGSARKRLARAAKVLGHRIVAGVALHRAVTGHGHSQAAVHLT